MNRLNSVRLPEKAFGRLILISLFLSLFMVTKVPSDAISVMVSVLSVQGFGVSSVDNAEVKLWRCSLGKVYSFVMTSDNQGDYRQSIQVRLGSSLVLNQLVRSLG